MREHFTSGSVHFRKAYMQSLIDVIEVDDRQIRIKGSKDVLGKPKRSGRRSQMSTNWRAGRNKTANTYVIEISLQFRAQGDQKSSR